MNARDAHSQEPVKEQIKMDELLAPRTMHLLERLSVAAKGRIRGTLQGKRRSRALGSSLEFADFRPYVPGDDIRRIDWNVYGRSGRAFVRQYWDEQELQIHLLVDVSRSMAFRPGIATNKLYYALQLAASVGYTALVGEDRVAVKLFAEQMLAELEPLRGRVSTPRLLRFLTDAWRGYADKESGIGVQAGGQAPVSDSDMQLAFNASSKLPRRAGQTWLFTDGLYATGIEQALSALIGSGQEVVFVHLLSPDELRPELDGELHLIDSELRTGKDVALSPGVLNNYYRALEEHREYIRSLCGRKGVTYLFIDTGTPLESTIHQVFRASGMLR